MTGATGRLGIAAGVLLAAAACGGDADGGGGGDAGPNAWSTIYSAVLRPRCIGCHDGATRSGGLDLSQRATARGNLVGVAAAGSACSGTGTARVVAGDAAASLLYRKLAGTQACGAQMPLGGPYLSDAQLARVEAWIAAGAPDD